MITITKNNWQQDQAKRQQPQWYALKSKPQHERKAAEQIKAWWGIETWCPVREEVHQWSDRKKHVEVPLLRGYVLICATEKERLHSLQHPGIIHCLTYLGQPSIIRQASIEILKQFITSYKNIEVKTLHPGSRALITEGSFAGVQGIIQDTARRKVTLALPQLGFLLEAPLHAVEAV
ncbi:Transcription antitermination factor NusG [bacterium A37T11]|nr:Transcription antitermination factor NusG [bacterium A37T11]